MEARPMNPEMAARTTNLTRFAITAAVALGGARAIGCSSAPSPQEPASTPTVGTTQQPDQSREVARIQKYIDSIYTRADVRDSFLTRFYETIDCVDPNGLWSVKALLAGGGALPQTPAAHLPQRAPEVAGKPLVDSAAEYWDDVRINSGRPDANGHPRTCPVGTAPQVRLTVDRILNAGGLDSFLLAVHGKAKPPPASAPPSNDDSTGFSHAYGDYEGSNGAALPNQGGAMWMSVWNPSLGINSAFGYHVHSLGQLWVTDVGSVQTVEVGWIVDPGLNANGDSDTYLFTNATVDGYVHTGCYDNLPSESSNTSGTSAECVAFVPNTAGGSNTPPFTPGQKLCSGSCSGMELEFAAINYNNSSNIPPNWYV